jgi:hypothetical protein
MARRYSIPARFALCSGLALVFSVGSALPMWAQFETRATTSLPEGAYSIAVADFNGDGLPDVAVVNGNGFTVSLGNGDGTFGKAKNYYDTSSAIVSFIAAGDFNNDGNVDLVTANGYNSISVYLGNGDGTFQLPKATTTTDYCSFVAVGDFNGDGKLDVAIIDSPNISVLLGKGDGTFQPPSDNDSFAIPEWLAVGDFNNDDKLDVVVVGSFGSTYSIGVLLGNGNGTLQSSLTYPLEYVPATVAAGDLRGDGTVDAVVGYDFDGIGVLLGNGNGSFQTAVNYDTGGLSGGPIFIGSLDSGGKTDLAIQGGPSAGVDVFWGNGDGTFQPTEFFASGDSGLLAEGDLNGDHIPDFVMANTYFGVISMLGTGVVSFSPSTAPLSFPVQLIKSVSAPQVVTLTNNGLSSLMIDSVKVSGEFQVSDTCEASVAPGSACTFTAAFRPTAAGEQTGLITIIDSASLKPQYIELSGSATAIKVAPSSLKFKGQKVGTRSAPQVVTLTNEGNTAFQFRTVYFGGTDQGDFLETNTCLGGSIGPGGNCKVTVTFAPKKSGARSAALSFSTPLNETGPAPVSVSGTGD